MEDGKVIELEYHTESLKKRCRVCASILPPHKYAYSCHGTKKKVLLRKLGINVENDEPHIHPDRFCQSCHTKAGQHSEAVRSTLEVFVWTAHVDPSSSCKVCCFLKKKSTGGRPKKMTMNRGRPLPFTTRIMRDAPNSMKSFIPLQPSRFLPTTFVAIEDLQYSICNYIVDQPVETPCRKLVCSLCIVRLFRLCDDVASLPCPSCKEVHEISNSSYPPVSKVVVKMLGELLLTCDETSCSDIVALKNLKKHVTSGCKHDTHNTFSPSKLTVRQIISRPLTSPPTSAEKTAASRVVKRMLGCSNEPSTSTSPSGPIIKLPTAGQVRRFIHVYMA